MIDDYEKEKDKLIPRNAQNKQSGIITYEKNISFVDFFEKNGIKQYCCRSEIISSVRLDDKLS
jgi:DNA-directed RNA polymerase subunit N (RpoN/RPB10)